MPVLPSPCSRGPALFAAISTIAAAVALSDGDTVAIPSVGVGADDAAASLGQSMQEFIVKYHGGRHARRDIDRLHRALQDTEAGFVQAAGLRRVRRLATGADLIRADRQLDRAEALALMRRLARDPQIEYVLPSGKA
ncbi:MULTISPECIES: hypothetical protein [unclassified Lysobacter]|uniref:hypothetical protein n=1 Tax=unclassified Lysobacter TaxID=2635362 RepID=UPI001BEB8A81|nr:MULTISPECIES: hypothetical protein [unclassified Lysobacter]MBT2747816.1 hypothetical protein [Lysobacter sp. ISL-42]MBT2751462.1 hypothetical protein [Lysobacter sp. ISL-50]MBT2778229.1 hypothetical protein [Lysobacter sp. ISL-54]MBT2782724.1 hypothetical protein [Lysobacter sp. ISL-52]